MIACVLVGVLLVVAGSPADASSYVGRSPYDGNCHWSRTVVGSADPFLSVDGRVMYGSFHVELRRSDACKSAWGYIRASGDWSGELSVWNPNKTSQRAWSNRYGNETFTIAHDAGLEACYGAHIYYRGRWNRWTFFGCVRAR